ncbi:MAG: hypothetical protein FJ096_11400 [Deltaproteobacteria bacterium]|nr:hypothetical protein [Deltaproteobacteria bacterium]
MRTPSLTLTALALVACATGTSDDEPSSTSVGSTVSASSAGGATQAGAGGSGGSDAATSASATGTASSSVSSMAMASSSSGGPLDVSGTCAAFCKKLKECSGTDEQTCLGTCATDFKDCSAVELDKVEGCAMGACSAFTFCVSDAKCVGNGT